MLPAETEETWEFYSCQIEEKPHSTLVNMSLREMAPFEDLRLFICLELHLRLPHPEHGMSTQEEFETLCDLEDLVLEKQSQNLRYVGRHTGDGKRKFYFYGTSQEVFRPMLDALHHAYPEYQTSGFDFEDSDWSVYFENLYPNAMGLNEIENRRVKNVLEARGDDLNVPRLVDHLALFGTESQALEFRNASQRRGFEATLNSPDETSVEYYVVVERVDRPAELDPVTYDLTQLAEQCGGTYDGWGCELSTSTSLKR